MAQEERGEEWNREVNSNMAARGEDYLESLLTDAFEGKGFQKISGVLEEREIEPLQKYNESLFGQLDKALRKELDKNEFLNVSLLLKCIQLYLKNDLQEGRSLFIEQGLVLTDSFNFYLVSWFERARAFVTLIDPNENKFLMLLLEDFFDSALVICRCSNEGKKELVNLFLPELGHLVTEADICCALRQEALRTLNSILDSVPREERKKFPLSEEMCSLTKDIAKTILEVGDYDLQVALSEALCRLMTKKWRDDLVHHWFEDSYLAEAFKEIKDREFETDCRKFLNQLNERLGDGRRVYSFPCISAFADANEVKKPSDEKLEEFWIDFNIGSQSVTFYVDSNEGALWDSVRLSKEAVSSYSLKEDYGEKIVKIYMKDPAILNKTEATKIKLSFSAEFEILSILRKVLGDEKMMQTQLKRFIVAPEGEAVVSLPSSAKKSKTPSPRTKAKPSEKPPEEEPMEESPPKVAEAKGKIFGYRASSQNQRKHLFSESNNENTSTGQSEKSWILDPQQRSLTKSLDYTRKRPRVRSKLKVLPVSSPSSGSDQQTKEGYYSKSCVHAASWSSWFMRCHSPLSAIALGKLTMDYTDEMSSEEIEGSPLLLDLSAKAYSSDEEKATQKFHDASGKLSREEETSKLKDSAGPLVLDSTTFLLSALWRLQRDGCSKTDTSLISEKVDNIFSGTVIKKPKFSSWETTHLSSDASYTPRKFLDSVEKEAEIQTGKVRLSKLETFQKIVVEELASLEKETQILANMERDAVDFWNAQLLKLNSFCNQQKQRIQSVDSALGETAKSFANATQNTTYERPMKKAVENNVFLVPSD
nr:PREDICTED: synaptonemal complex protein 2-like [Phalacrocorax carbo]